MRLLRPLFFLLVLALSLPAIAQKNNRFPLEQINISGSKRYSTQAIVTALGLHVGQQTTQKELEDLASKLGTCGLFNLVQFRFGWASKGVVANYDVTDNTNLVPIDFENFVWFSPNELAASLKNKLPLFTGVVPLSGDYNDQIRAALQQVLVDHQLKGDVVALPQGPLSGQIVSMLYRVDGNPVRITSCDFPGADHADNVALSELAKATMVTNYEKSFVNPSLHDRLKDIYDLQGYLAARFDEPEVKVVSVAPDHTEVAVTTKVNEGPQFKFGGIRWTGNTVISPEELSKSLKYQPGQVASIPRIRQDLESVKALYGKFGYIGLKIDLTPELTGDQAMFTVKVREGQQYRTGTVQLDGLDPSLLAKVLSEWQMKSGEIYDASYAPLYMTRSFGKFVPLSKRWEWHNREVIHDDNKTVDLLVEVRILPRT